MKLGTAARIWHGVTAGVAAFAIMATAVLVLADDDPPALSIRLIQLVSYFTIQANLLVLFAAMTLTQRVNRDGVVWRVLRLNGLVGIAVTGIVHWFLLRPLVALSGWSYVCDVLLHVAVPLLAIVGWLAFGPRRRVTGRTVLLGLIWPVAWLIYTMIIGAITGWYPYPFLDVGQVGDSSVALALAGIGIGLIGLSGLIWLCDRRLPGGRWDAAGTTELTRRPSISPG